MTIIEVPIWAVKTLAMVGALSLAFVAFVGTIYGIQWMLAQIDTD